MPACPKCGGMTGTSDRGGWTSCFKCGHYWNVYEPLPAYNLVEELEKLYEQLCHQHERVIQDANRQNAVSYELRYKDGKYVLADILAAKASVLNALTNLKKGR